MTRTTPRVLACFALLIAVGCKPAANKPPEQTPAPAAQAPAAALAITDIDWNLTALGEQTNPLGAGGKQVTLRLDSATRRASGFGGCNRYSGSYTLHGDSLAFGAVMATRMACTDGMELEAAWHKAVPTIVTYAATETTLTLNAAEGPVASFRK